MDVLAAEPQPCKHGLRFPELNAAITVPSITIDRTVLLLPVLVVFRNASDIHHARNNRVRILPNTPTPFYFTVLPQFAR
jgi:hypothetical protein